MEKESQSIYRKNLRAFRKIGGSTITTMKIEIYKDEGYKLMGAAFEVYNEQGHGLAEEIYQESLEIELEMRGILSVEAGFGFLLQRSRVEEALRPRPVCLRLSRRRVEGGQPASP